MMCRQQSRKWSRHGKQCAIRSVCHLAATCEAANQTSQPSRLLGKLQDMLELVPNLSLLLQRNTGANTSWTSCTSGTPAHDLLLPDWPPPRWMSLCPQPEYHISRSPAPAQINLYTAEQMPASKEAVLAICENECHNAVCREEPKSKVQLGSKDVIRTSAMLAGKGPATHQYSALPLKVFGVTPPAQLDNGHRPKFLRRACDANAHRSLLTEPWPLEVGQGFSVSHTVSHTQG